MNPKKVTPEKIIKIAEKVFQEYIKLPEELTNRSDRKGGYLTVLNTQINRIEAIRLFGELPKEKAVKCIKISQEKANRLYQKIFVENLNHLTSWESRDPDNTQYGGAVYNPYCIYNNYILSFSGLPEIGDEICMLVLQVLISSRKNEVQLSPALDIYNSICVKNIGDTAKNQFRSLLAAFDIAV